MAEIEEKALRCGKLSTLLLGKTSEEVVKAIGEPRITAGAIKGWHDSMPDQLNALYFIGFQPMGVCVSYSKNICVAVETDGAHAQEIERDAFSKTKDFALGKHADEISKFLNHELPLGQSQGPPYSAFDVGDMSEWSFHFVNGTCDDVSASFIFH